MTGWGIGLRRAGGGVGLMAAGAGAKSLDHKRVKNPAWAFWGDRLAPVVMATRLSGLTAGSLILAGAVWVT